MKNARDTPLILIGFCILQVYRSIFSFHRPICLANNRKFVYFLLTSCRLIYIFFCHFERFLARLSKVLARWFTYWTPSIISNPNRFNSAAFFFCLENGCSLSRVPPAYSRTKGNLKGLFTSSKDCCSDVQSPGTED